MGCMCICVHVWCIMCAVFGCEVWGLYVCGMYVGRLHACGRYVYLCGMTIYGICLCVYLCVELCMCGVCVFMCNAWVCVFMPMCLCVL